MLFVNRLQLMVGLEAVRRSLCPYRHYAGRDGCDCKYGASLRGEQTGCPEVREAIGLLKAMTDEEFKDLTTRAGSIDVEALRHSLNLGSASPKSNE